MAGLVPFNRGKSEMKSTGIDDFYSMLDNFFEDTWIPARSLVMDTFKLDVQDKEKEYTIEAELPGVKKDEVKIELMENHLLIDVERSEKVDEEKKNYIHKERRFTSMQRSVYLRDAKADGIKAKLDNGVLMITVPKEESKITNKKIEIE
ncbi:MAG: Hsp20/alpha crystallin family protein [Saccharofermentanales bacterium]